jgi:hypothetical protein
MVNSASQVVENLRLMYMPRDRRALVRVPVALWGEESAPGVKGGGWLHVVNRAVPLMCQGWAVPPKIELDVGKMRVSWGHDGSCGVGAVGSAAAVECRTTARDKQGSASVALASKLMSCGVLVMFEPGLAMRNPCHSTRATIRPADG